MIPVPTRHALLAGQAIPRKRLPGFRDSRGKIEKCDLPGACRLIDSQPVSDEQRVAVAADNTSLVMACDQRFKRVAKRGSVAEPDFAIVPMARFQAGDEAESFFAKRGWSTP